MLSHVRWRKKPLYQVWISHRRVRHWQRHCIVDGTRRHIFERRFRQVRVRQSFRQLFLEAFDDRQRRWRRRQFLVRSERQIFARQLSLVYAVDVAVGNLKSSGLKFDVIWLNTLFRIPYYCTRLLIHNIKYFWTEKSNYTAKLQPAIPIRNEYFKYFTHLIFDALNF